jgi:hypothetical protein
MKKKEKRFVYEDVISDIGGKKVSFRDVLTKRLKIETYFSAGEVIFVESSQASN